MKVIGHFPPLATYLSSGSGAMVRYRTLKRGSGDTNEAENDVFAVGVSTPTVESYTINIPIYLEWCVQRTHAHPVGGKTYHAKSQRACSNDDRWKGQPTT